MIFLESYRLLRVFLASPSDLQEERRIAKIEADAANRLLREIGWQIELLGWEDCLPGTGRPQEQINHDVDACDLFVGVLWRRWGSPSGEYESGFEEEIERALERNRSSGKPEIWVFFKEIESDLIEDPGEQLKRVLTFKQSIAEGRELLYKEFSSTEVWGGVFRETLLRYVIRGNEELRRSETVDGTARSALSIEGYPATVSVSSVGEDKRVPDQIQGVLSHFAELSASRDIASFKTDIENSDRFEVARLFLLSSTWFSRYSSNEPLGNHEANLIYLLRKQMDLLPDERYHLIRSMIQEGNRYIPGWYWFGGITDDSVERIIWGMANSSAFGEVKKTAALGFLAKSAGFSNLEIDHDDLITRCMADGSESVVAEALNYAVRFGTGESIPAIERAKERISQPARDTAEDSVQLILGRCDPDEGFKRAISSEKELNSAVMRVLEKNSGSITSENLRLAINHSAPGIRELVVKELSARGELQSQEAIQLLDDPSSRVRAAAIERSLDLGGVFSPSEIRRLIDEANPEDSTSVRSILSGEYVFASPLVKYLFERYEFEDLERSVDWLSIDGPIAYEVLCTKHYSKWEETLRRDLSENFSRLRTVVFESIGEDMEKQLDLQDPAFIRKMIGSFSKHLMPNLDQRLSYLVVEYATAAMNGLISNEATVDLGIVRPYLKSKSQDASRAAAHLIEMAGDESDVEALLGYAQSTYGSDAASAAKGAISLAGEPWPMALRFLKEGDINLVNAASEFLLENPELISWEDLFEFLFREKVHIRERVLAVHLALLDKTELELLLDRYLEGSEDSVTSYYYDVVTSIDKAVHAPSAWR